MAATTDADHDWTARHARTGPTETKRVVDVPDDCTDWDLRHAETKSRS
ncbi:MULTISPECIES: hypothetical protein [unclassified Haloarcula]|nr:MULTISPECIES: hypothetical protein [unclassified Haloarcula]